MFTGTYEFKVLEYNETDDESRWQHGYLMANSYKDALDQLIAYFGEEALENVQLTMVSNSELLFLPEEYAEVMKEYNGF